MLTLPDYEVPTEPIASTNPTTDRLADIMRNEIPSEVRQALRTEIEEALAPVGEDLRRRLPEIILQIVIRRFSTPTEAGTPPLSVVPAHPIAVASPQSGDTMSEHHHHSSLPTNIAQPSLDLTTERQFLETATSQTIRSDMSAGFPMTDFSWMINDSFGTPDSTNQDACSPFIFDDFSTADFDFSTHKNELP